MGLEFLFTFTAVAVFLLLNAVIVFFMRQAAPETFRRLGVGRVLAGYGLVVLAGALFSAGEGPGGFIASAIVAGYLTVALTTLVLVPMAMILTFFNRGSVAALAGAAFMLTLLLTIAKTLMSEPGYAYFEGDKTLLSRDLRSVAFFGASAAAFSIGLLWRNRRLASSS